jgi:hypothetical protein
VCAAPCPWEATGGDAEATVAAITTAVSAMSRIRVIFMVVGIDR